MTELADRPTRSDGFFHDITAVAGPPPLIVGESAAGYERLLAQVCEALQPSDVLEQIWTRDVVDLAWEVFRLRRLKASLMWAAAYEGMREVLTPLCDYADDVAKAWATRRDAAVQVAENALIQAELSIDAVTARTLSVRIDDFERIDRMTAAAEARRNAALRQIDLHRAGFALRLRRAVQEVEQAVEDAELEVVAPAAPAHPAAPTPPAAP
jgi:hypothetical protein